MKVRLYSIYDQCAKAYNQPLFMLSDEVAQRSFTDAVNDPETNFFKHPSDYTMFYLGEFDDSSGTFELASQPIKIVGALEVKQSFTGQDLFNEVSNETPVGHPTGGNTPQ